MIERLRIWLAWRVSGAGADSLLRSAVRRRDWHEAAAVQDVTGATISDTEIMRLAHDRDEVYA